MFNLFWIVSAGHIYQVSSILRNGTVIAQLLYLRNVMFQSYKFNISILDSSCPVPDVHYAKHHSSHNKGCITTMWEFIYVGYQECTFYCNIYGKKNINQCRIDSPDHHIVCKQNSSH